MLWVRSSLDCLLKEHKICFTDNCKKCSGIIEYNYSFDVLPPLSTEPLEFIVENVTEYAFSVATNWKAIGFKTVGPLLISFQLNQGDVQFCHGRGDNTTHVFCTIFVMRPKTMFTVRFRGCIGYTGTCTDFSRKQAVLTKTAGKLSSIGYPVQLYTIKLIAKKWYHEIW